jgi:hypothetical protein
LSNPTFPELLFGALRVPDVSGDLPDSAQPSFHGLQRPQADDLRALILRWVSLVFTRVLDDAVCGAALFLGHAAFVVWPQVPTPFGRGYQGVFAFVGQGKRQE